MLTTEWRKSTRSSNGANCVQGRTRDGRAEIGDTKDPHGPTLVFAPGAWRAFVDELRGARQGS